MNTQAALMQHAERQSGAKLVSPTHLQTHEGMNENMKEPLPETAWSWIIDL